MLACSPAFLGPASCYRFHSCSTTTVNTLFVGGTLQHITSQSSHGDHVNTCEHNRQWQSNINSHFELFSGHVTQPCCCRCVVVSVHANWEKKEDGDKEDTSQKTLTSTSCCKSTKWKCKLNDGVLVNNNQKYQSIDFMI